jgi:hypothetical protein
MGYGICVQTATMATNVDSLVRSVKCAGNVENGMVFQLASRSSTAGEGEVWVATVPSSSAGLTHLWMACEPEVVTTVSGTNKYKGLDPDIRNFINLAGDVFTAFKPQIGDLIQLSEDVLAGSKSTNTHVVATASAWELTWAGAAVSGLSLKLLGDKDISVGVGTLGSTQKQTAYLFEVVAIA